MNARVAKVRRERKRTFSGVSAAAAIVLLSENDTEVSTMSKRTTIATLAVAGALGLGALGSAALAESSPPPRPVSTPPPATGQPGPVQGAEAQDPAYHGSVGVPRTASDGSEAQEAAALAGLARITAAQADAAALAKFPGATIQATTLEDENGSLVWGVSLREANGTTQDVKVDAGTGTVLAAEAGHDGTEATGATEPATETDAGD